MSMTKANQNPKVVHIDYEEKMSLENAAAFLESIAVKLKTDKSFTLTQGEKTHFISPTSNVELEVKLEERNGKHKLELELKWYDQEITKNNNLEIG